MNYYGDAGSISARSARARYGTRGGISALPSRRVIPRGGVTRQRVAVRAPEKKRPIEEVLQGKVAAYERTMKKSRVKVKVKKLGGKALPIRNIAVIAAFTALAIGVMLSNIWIYETTTRASASRKAAAVMQREESELLLQIEKKVDLAYVEEVASGRLKMVKKDVLPKKYISLHEGDRVEVMSGAQREGITEAIVRFFAG